MELISNEKQEKSIVKLTIKVGAEEFQKAVESVYRKNVKNINVPGFRKGKAPRKMIEKMYGEGVFFEDAVNSLYPSAYEKALAESGVDAVGRAEIDIEELSKDGFTFYALVPVKPEVTVTSYKGLEAEYEEVKVLAEDVKKEIDKLAERASSTQAVDRKAKKTDVAVIDFEGFVDGVAFEGGKGEDFNLVLGSGQFIPGFEEQLIGLKAGESKDVVVTFPEAYHSADLAGKEATFKCTVKEVRETIKPTLDDEFAKDVSEFDTMDALKADLKEKMTESRKEAAEQAFSEKLLDVLIGNLEAEIPQAMYEEQLDKVVEDFGRRMAMQGMPFENYLQMNGTDEGGFRKLFAPQAERQVKIRLALEKVAEMENIQVTDEMIEQEYAELAEQYKLELAQVKSAVSAEALKGDIATQKALEAVRDAAKMIKVKKSAKKKAEGEEETSEEA